jgi:hypothetical protein
VRRFLALVALAACSGGGSSHGVDAAPDSVVDAPPDYPACHELAQPGNSLPVHVSGTLAGADLEAPASCATVDAPYGIESAGPDSVVRVDGLAPGTTYVVRLVSGADLAFYVVTGCSTATGPSTDECQLFVDATAEHREVATFTATATIEYVVIDYYQSHPPPDASWTLDVYAQGCTADAQCSGATPVCDDGRCVECTTSFDCASADAPRCDPTTDSCTAGTDQCLTDDTGEPANDGPAGAPVIAPDGTSNGMICSVPDSEADYVAFDVTSLGETWDLGLAWSGTRDLDLEVFDATGTALGVSFWEQPEHVRLTYLPLGRYYARVTEFQGDATGVAYTLTAQRTAGTGCTSSADCAAEYRNQIFRGACQGGACVAIDGAGAVAKGGACDSLSDCATDLSCSSFFFVANADTRDVCEPTCASDADCDTGYVCTTYLSQNFCVQKCTTDAQCPTALDSQPASGQPWSRLSCDVATGRCLP